MPSRWESTTGRCAPPTTTSPIKSADVSDLPSEIGATSCGRYDTVINGLRNARLGLGDEEMVGVKVVRRILRQTQFGCTVHSTVFDAGASKDLPWE